MSSPTAGYHGGTEECGSRKRDWTVMLYLAGDNSLTEEMVLALQMIRDTGLPDDLDIVAQLDPSGLGIPTQRYDFRRKPLDSSNPLERYRVPCCEYDIDETNTGNPDALSGFIDWATKGREAEHYMLIISGHGSGSTEDFLALDENPFDSLTIPELAKALADGCARLPQNQSGGGGKRIDILGMDACYMSMAEVCYEIRHHIDYVVGAESLEPEFGWPYHRLLAAAKAWADPRGRPRPMSAERLATMIVEEYVNFWADHDQAAGRSVDLAAIELRDGKIAQVQAAVGALASALKRALADDEALGRVILTHWWAQSYKNDQFNDLYDLCIQARRQFPEGDSFGVHAAAGLVMCALEGSVLLSCTSGWAYQHSYGLSVYFPWAVIADEYATLDFASGDCGWFDFLACYLERSRRERREDWCPPPIEVCLCDGHEPVEECPSDDEDDAEAGPQDSDRRAAVRFRRPDPPAGRAVRPASGRPAGAGSGGPARRPAR